MDPRVYDIKSLHRVGARHTANRGAGTKTPQASLAANATPFLHQTLARPDVISGSAIAGVPVMLKTAWEAQSDWSKEVLDCH